MLKEAVLVSSMLIMLSCLSIFAEQSTEELLGNIDLAIERYEVMKFIGIGLFFTGVAGDLTAAFAIGGAAAIGIGGFLWIFDDCKIEGHIP